MLQRFLVIVVCLLTVFSSLSAKKKSVIVVCPYSPSGDWAKKMLTPITELDKKKVDVSFVVMRNTSFKSVEDMEEREQTIFTSNTRPDLVIIFGTGNFIIADDFNKKWQGVPMILTGELNYVCEKEYVCDSVARSDAKRIPITTFARGKNMTFIYTPIYCNETMELMIEAIWGMKKVYFFGGEEYLSREIELNMEQAAKAMGKDFQALHPDDCTFSKVSKMATVSNLQNDAYIYCNWHNKEGELDKTIPSQGFRRTLEKVVPLFNIFYSDITPESNTAGFVSYDHDEFVETMKANINAILNNNVQAVKIPFSKIARSIPVVNYAVFARLGFDLSTINEDVTFVNTPETIWDKYKILIVALVVLFITLFVYTIFYLRNRNKMLKKQRELQREKDRAIESDQMKTAFVQNVSHEIRTPLNAVVGFSQLLALPDDIVTPEEKNQYVEYIQNNSEMLIMLINDILSVSDIERGLFLIEMGDVMCNDVCRRAMRTAETRVPDGVRMYFTTEVADDFKIYSDPKRVQQVLINYLTNACKHTEKGEIHVHCSLTENPGKVTFSVTDTGTGVPVEMAEKIFERFTKLQVHKQGVGLGLNICRTVAGKLNGEVKLDTSYTGGARFVFIVPAE